MKPYVVFSRSEIMSAPLLGGRLVCSRFVLPRRRFLRCYNRYRRFHHHRVHHWSGLAVVAVVLLAKALIDTTMLAASNRQSWGKFRYNSSVGHEGWWEDEIPEGIQLGRDKEGVDEDKCVIGLDSRGMIYSFIQWEDEYGETTACGASWERGWVGRKTLRHHTRIRRHKCVPKACPSYPAWSDGQIWFVTTRYRYLKVPLVGPKQISLGKDRPQIHLFGQKSKFSIIN